MSEAAGEAPRKKARARARGKRKTAKPQTNYAAEAEVRAPENGEDKTPAETLEEAAERLAGLTKGRYEQLRMAEAGRLKARVSALDELVEVARNRGEGGRRGHRRGRG
jgi:hypothetical protein